MYKLKFWMFIVLGIGILSSSCTQEGCTDPHAKNFSYDAEKDDGSCDYSGCTDPDALNYNPNAEGDDGSCTYLGGVQIITTRTSVKPSDVFLAVKISNEFIGNLQKECTVQFPTCESACSHLKFTEKESGFYSMQFWEIRQTSSTTFDTLFESQSLGVQVVGNKCNIVVIE